MVFRGGGPKWRTVLYVGFAAFAGNERIGGIV